MDGFVDQINRSWRYTCLLSLCSQWDLAPASEDSSVYFMLTVNHDMLTNDCLKSHLMP